MPVNKQRASRLPVNRQFVDKMPVRLPAPTLGLPVRHAAREDVKHFPERRVVGDSDKHILAGVEFRQRVDAALSQCSVFEPRFRPLRNLVKRRSPGVDLVAVAGCEDRAGARVRKSRIEFRLGRQRLRQGSVMSRPVHTREMSHVCPQERERVWSSTDQGTQMAGGVAWREDDVETLVSEIVVRVEAADARGVAVEGDFDQVSALKVGIVKESVWVCRMAGEQVVAETRADDDIGGLWKALDIADVVPVPVAPNDG